MRLQTCIPNTKPGSTITGALRIAAAAIAVAARMAWGPGRRLALTMALLLAALPGLVALAPEPEAVPRRWQLDATAGQLRVTTIEVDGKPRTFYYMTYTVVNNSGEDLLFAPSFELATDDGKLVRSGRNVPLEVTRTLLERTQNPLIQDQISIISELLQGKENAKQGLVVWTAEGMNIGEITVYGAGFSGETATVEMPDTKEKVVLRKTLMLHYPVRGTLIGQRNDPIEPDEKRWIMR